MRRFHALSHFAFWVFLAWAVAPAYSQQGRVQDKNPFPGVTSKPMAAAPLSAQPYVYALKRLEPGQMSSGDAALVSSLKPELGKAAALASFDLSNSGWTYQQIACPAFPDFVLLSFRHGPDPDGSSRFVAALARESRGVWIVSTAAHGLSPFAPAWNKPASYEIFNRMLRQERGLVPLGNAPNWLVISMCYAELSGHRVQVLTSQPWPFPTMDLLRLEASLPQILIQSDRSATITFSDASKPKTTTDWALTFDRRGQIVSAALTSKPQARNIALHP